MAKDYEVGYGRPPKKNQFPKDTSGNPKGRPKGSRNKRTIVQDSINRKVAVRENGRTREISSFEALVESMRVDALTGTLNEKLKYVQFIEKLAPEELEEVPKEDRTITIQYVLPDGKTMEDYDEDEPRSTERNDRLAGTEAREHDPDNEEASIEAAWRASGIDDEPEDGSEQ